MKKTIAILLVVIFSLSLVAANDSLSSKESLARTVILMVAMEKSFLDTVAKYGDAKTNVEREEVLKEINNIRALYKALNNVIRENNKNPEYYMIFSYLEKATDAMDMCIGHFNSAVENVDFTYIPLVENELNNYKEYIDRACKELENI